MKLSALLNKRAETDVIFEEEGLHIAFAPNKFDANMMSLLSDSGGIEQVVKMLSHVMLDWDLTDDKDKKVPCDEETLRSVPIGLLNSIAKAIMTEVTGAKNAENS